MRMVKNGIENEMNQKNKRILRKKMYESYKTENEDEV